VIFDEHQPARRRSGVGDDADDPVRRSVSWFTRSYGLVDHTFFLWLMGKSAMAVR
jgi:hypothetical protein